ncbi:hypothetical protein AAFF_G00303840 [Aldrovandia affinis]|uniref:Uncharacterized protein n=1 Tax=Aldrovandia affinis TaxID=143900 RepID=A0AAD7WRC2_9TELE|nr:hypothetical protein AAFF_G00303840 [Aldrovandia affinis]
MLGYGCVFISCLLTVTLLLSGSDGLQSTSVTPKYLDAVAVEESSSWAPSGEKKSASKPTNKLLPLGQLWSAFETKRKRSVTGGNTPLDRLSVSNMDLKGKKRKEVESPRRRPGLRPPTGRPSGVNGR